MNPLAIRIAADLKAFKANMEEMRTQLETNASAMKRMSSAFDGSKVIGDANAMVKAIHDIGGASKLTEAEQKRVNAAVTEALAKYQALGRQAPSDLIALRDATQKVNTEAQKTPSLMDQMTTKATAFGVAAGTFLGNMAWSAVNKLGAEIGEFAQRGLQLQAIEASFVRLASGAKQSSSEMLSSMKTASRGMVSEFDLMKAANKAMLLGLPVTSAEMGTLTKAAVTIGKAMGQDATKSVDDLITALGRSSPMILDNLGITVKVGEANEIYAKKLGKTAEQLSDAEKKTAFYEEAMRKANDKTKELGDSTKTLGERLETAWVSVGNVVTGVVSDFNIGLGAALSNTKNFGLFLETAMKAGFGAAVHMFAEMERGKSVVDKLTKSEELAAAALFKKGETVQQVAKFLAVSEAAVQAFAKSLEKIPPAVDKNKKAAKEFKESWNFTGDLISGDLFGYGEIIGKQIEAGIRAETGETLEELLARRWKLGKSFSGEFRDYGEIIQKEIDAGITAAPGETLEQLLARRWGMAKSFGGASASELINGISNFGEKAGISFSESFQKALSGLGNVIVGALQGGGDVGRAAFAHLGNSLGSDLGAEIAKGIGGSLGKMLGGLAGPLGSMLGGLVGGALDKIFGKNQGREDAKAFAAMFGGFDALREKMLVLGAEGERLWIALTQNTRGPAQVAQAIKAIEDALAKAEEQAGRTGEALEDAFKGPEGARGFPTRAQLQKAAEEAKAAYDYMLASGEYTADVLTQAWEQWQDAMIASGDETAKRMKVLTDEINSLQKAVEAETPEYDADGVRMYGVEELRNIERLAALEAEKTALQLANIEKEQHATEEAAAAADLTAKKEFEAAKIRALDLDGYLRKLFSGGYEIPITFRLPGGLPTGGGLPSGGSPFGQGAPLPTLPSRASAAPTNITVVSLLDGREVARNQVKYIPRELDFIGARR